MEGQGIWFPVSLPTYSVSSRTSSPGVNRLACEANYSTPPTAVIKNEWSYTSTFPYVCCVMGQRLIKYKDSVTLTIDI